MELTITRRLSSVIDDLDSKLKTLYSINNFEYVIKKLEKCNYESNRPSILAELFEMFDNCNIKYDKGKDDKYYKDLVKKIEIPDFLEIEKDIMKNLFDKYKEYPSPQDYMKRIVDNLEFDEKWRNDTLRVRILKQFIKYGNFLADVTKNGKRKYGGELFIRKYVNNKLGNKVPNTNLEINDEFFLNLDDNIFLEYNNIIEYERNKSNKNKEIIKDIYQKFSNLDKIILKIINFNEKFKRIFDLNKKVLEDFKTLENIEEEFNNEFASLEKDSNNITYCKDIEATKAKLIEYFSEEKSNKELTSKLNKTIEELFEKLNFIKYKKEMINEIRKTKQEIFKNFIENTKEKIIKSAIKKVQEIKEDFKENYEFNYDTLLFELKKIENKIFEEIRDKNIQLKILEKFLEDINAVIKMTENISIKEYEKKRKAIYDDIKKEINKLEDSVQSVNSYGGKFGLLRICDDLANGKFYIGGVTKTILYHFAMVYGMTYYSKKTDEIEVYKSDIEKNLFRDYYTNNLIRYITDVYKGHLNEYELDPSGQGINYKNFAEVIYIYFISKNYSPQEKIKLSNEMINRVQEKTIEHRHNFKGTDTKIIKNEFIENLLNLTENDFENFICKKYNCSTIKIEEKENGEKSRRTLGIMQVETEQNTAFKKYQEIINKIKQLGVLLEECNYGLYFTDVSFFRKHGYKFIFEKYGYEIFSDDTGKCDYNSVNNFIDLLIGINNFIGNTKTSALFVSKPENVTRTSMLVAYYYYYIASADKNLQYLGGMGFKEVFYDFKNGVDVFLEASFYQPLSGKNFFDLTLVFSIYDYLYEEISATI